MFAGMTRMFMLVAVLVLGAVSAQAESVLFDFGNPGDVRTFSQDGITFTAGEGVGNFDWGFYSTAPGAVYTISSSDKTITGVTFSNLYGDFYPYVDGSFTYETGSASASADGYDFAWTGSASTVVFTTTSDPVNFVVSSVTITYEESEGPAPLPTEIKGYVGTYKEDGVTRKKLVEISGGLFTWAARLEEGNGYYLTILGNPYWEEVYFLDLTTGSLPQTKTYYTIDENHDIYVGEKKVGFIMDANCEEAVRYAVNMTVDLKSLINQASTIDLTGVEGEALSNFEAALAAAQNADQFVDDFGTLYNELEAAMEATGKEPLQPFNAYVAVYKENTKELNRVVRIENDFHLFIFKPSNKGYYITLSVAGWEDNYYLNLSPLSIPQEPVYYQLDGEEIILDGKALGIWLDPTDKRFTMYLMNSFVDAEEMAALLETAKAYDTTGHDAKLVKYLEDAIAAMENADPFIDDYKQLMMDIEEALDALNEESTEGISNIYMRTNVRSYGLDGRRASRGILVLDGKKMIK